MEQIFELTVEMPPFSGNHRHGWAGRRKFRTKSYNEWLTLLQSQLPETPIFDPEQHLYLEVEFQFKDRRKRDLDNCLKSLLDGLNGRVFHDDCQIHRLQASKSIGDKFSIRLKVAGEGGLRG